MLLRRVRFVAYNAHAVAPLLRCAAALLSCCRAAAALLLSVCVCAAADDSCSIEQAPLAAAFLCLCLLPLSLRFCCCLPLLSCCCRFAAVCRSAALLRRCCRFPLSLLYAIVCFDRKHHGAKNRARARFYMYVLRRCCHAVSAAYCHILPFLADSFFSNAALFCTFSRRFAAARC